VNAEIFAIGSELLTPFRQDTNSLFLTERLHQLGVEVVLKTIVGDNRERLISIARDALLRSDILFFMGGLGPTEDDVTREAVAEALGVGLHRDEDLVKKLAERFAARGYTMTPNNHQQADVIDGAIVLPNPNGSAPGQWINTKHDGRERILILLPGPPFELRAMFDEQCRDRLRIMLPTAFIATRVLKVAMMGESLVDSRVAPIYKQYKDIQTTILAGAGDIFTRAESLEAAEQRVEELAGKIEDELGDALYSSKGDSLEQIVGYYLQMRNSTLAVAESCTGGLLAERITSISGSSRYFLGGSVVYSNELKTEFAGVPANMIAKYGAVSREVGAALAEGIRSRTGATLSIGITGVAGPTGGTPEKPIGRVYVALSSAEGTEIEERNFPGDRKRIRWFATQLALDMVRRKLI
jgi:nicotinamide-nucleotide amidase